MFFRSRYFLFILCFLALSNCSYQKPPAKHPPKLSTIAFGSCLRQWQKIPVLKSISALQPDVFIFLGDNVYSDTAKYSLQKEPQRIKNAYQDLADSVEYRAFLKSNKENDTKIYAIWDDHDYGKNDAGADYKYKVESKKIFQQFFNISKTVTGADQAGTYRSDYFTLNDINIQLILLDTRSFRSPLHRQATSEQCPKINHAKNVDKNATVLGKSQWQWLEAELLKPADIRLLATSIQLIPTEHCYEKWENFPKERQRFFNLLRRTDAQGVILLSGDRHLAEISVLPANIVGYPLYEITSSSLNASKGINNLDKQETNQYRVLPKNVSQNNFGTLQMNRIATGIEVNLQIRDEAGFVLQQIDLTLNP